MNPIVYCLALEFHVCFRSVSIVHFFYLSIANWFRFPTTLIYVTIKVFTRNSLHFVDRKYAFFRTFHAVCVSWRCRHHSHGNRKTDNDRKQLWGCQFDMNLIRRKIKYSKSISVPPWRKFYRKLFVLREKSEKKKQIVQNASKFELNASSTRFWIFQPLSISWKIIYGKKNVISIMTL